MAYRPWTTPTGLLSGRRGGGSYSMAGPGNRSASISALQAISNPGSVANIAAPVMPADSLPLSVQADTPITSAMRGPGPRRSSAPVVGGGPSLRSQTTPTPEMDFGGEDFMGDYMGGLQPPAGSGMPGAFNPMAGMPGSLMPTAANLSSPLKVMPNTTQGGHIIPEHLYGNPRAIAALKRSGLSYEEWERTMDASNYI